MKKTAIALSLALLGCSSAKKHPDQPQPRIEDHPAPASTASTAPKPDAPPASQEPIAITIKKGDKRAPEAAYKGTPPPGSVFFDFKNVDLEKVALPLFSKQAGVIVEYGGPPRKLTLGFNQPIAWREALALVCQFTNTHVARSQIAGRLELKDGFADPAPFLARFDPNDKTATNAGQGVLGSTEGGADATTSSGTKSSATASGGQATDTSNQIDTSNYRDPSQDYNDKVDSIRKNVTPTNSGAK